MAWARHCLEKRLLDGRRMTLLLHDYRRHAVFLLPAVPKPGDTPTQLKAAADVARDEAATAASAAAKVEPVRTTVCLGLTQDVLLRILEQEARNVQSRAAKASQDAVLQVSGG